MLDIENYDISINSCAFTKCDEQWNWVTAKQGFKDYDLWFITGGKGYIEYLGNKYELHEGKCFLLSPNIQYIAYHDIADMLSVIHIHFDFVKNGMKAYPFGVIDSNTGSANLIIQALEYVMFLYNIKDYQRAYIWFKAVLCDLFGECASANDGIDKGIHEVIYSICRVIGNSVNIPNLAEFAEQYSYSVSYLGKMFTKITGMSYTDYVNHTKLNKAKVLLCSTNKSLSRIAEETGYYDVSYFSRQFKKNTGISPGKFRKSSTGLE